MEDPSHYPINIGKNSRRRGNARGNTTFVNTSAQESKDGPRKSDFGKQWVNANRDPEREEIDYIADQRTTETG